MEGRRNRSDQIMPYWLVKIKKLVHYPKVKDWCGLPYNGHPKGCPNFNSDKKHCPYNSLYITKVLDMNKPMYFVYSEFDLIGHIKRMKKKHPEWSDRMCRNVLYWQKRSRKQMMERAKEGCLLTGNNLIIPNGESLGVHLYATCRLSGLKLKKIRDIDICHHVAIIGRRKR